MAKHIEDPIPKLYEEYKNMRTFLLEQKEVEKEQLYSQMFRRYLVLSVASYLEEALKRLLEQEMISVVGEEHWLYHFAKNKGIERQYHTLFDWKTNNANTFLASFGEAFKQKCKDILDKEEKASLDVRPFNNSVEAFMKIGRLRNQLAHGNFASSTVGEDFTPEEIYAKYESAKAFLEFVKQQLI